MNPRKKYESYQADYYSMEQLTRMVWEGNVDIRAETMEMLLLKYLWRKSKRVALRSAKAEAVDLKTRKKILDQAGLDLDPKKC